MDNQIITPRTRLDDWEQSINFLYGTLASLTAKKISVDYEPNETKLPSYTLPYGERHFGNNPPKPNQRGFEEIELC